MSLLMLSRKVAACDLARARSPGSQTKELKNEFRLRPAVIDPGWSPKAGYQAHMLVEPYPIWICRMFPKDEHTGSQAQIVMCKLEEGRSNTFPDTETTRRLGIQSNKPK